MIVLQSFSRFDDIALIDCETNSVEFASKSNRPHLSVVRIAGLYATLGGEHLFLYRDQSILRLRCNDTITDFDDLVTIIYERSSKRLLRIIRGSLIILHVYYTIPEEDEFFLRVDAFSDEEDVDFGLLLYNLATDKPRRDRLWR